jgi:hypothetical protein
MTTVCENTSCFQRFPHDFDSANNVKIMLYTPYMKIDLKHKNCKIIFQKS